jgi:hypothetical protein
MKRLWHPWFRWECFKAGFYESTCSLDADAAKDAYAQFLRDTPRFEAALQRVITEWPTSCEHFLSNESINRIAWLGQASMCIATGVPACFRGGFKRLSTQQQRIANATADKWLRIWLRAQADAQKNREVHPGVESERLFG